MKRLFAVYGLVGATAVYGAAAEKPRVFVTESQALQLSGDATVGDAKGNVSLAGGASREIVEVMRAFRRYCPDVVVTANREKAAYVVRLDHEAPGPTTPFVHGNKVAVFDTHDDLIYTDSTHTLGSAVKGACRAMTNPPGA